MIKHIRDLLVWGVIVIFLTWLGKNYGGLVFILAGLSFIGVWYHYNPSNEVFKEKKHF